MKFLVLIFIVLLSKCKKDETPPIVNPPQNPPEVPKPLDLTVHANFIFSEKSEGLSIGNGPGGEFFEVYIYGDLDFNNQVLEINNARVIITGDTIRSGGIILRDSVPSELIVKGNMLKKNKDHLKGPIRDPGGYHIP